MEIHKETSPPPVFEPLPSPLPERTPREALEDFVRRGFPLDEIHPIELVQSIVKQLGSFIQALRGMAGMDQEPQPQNI